MLRKIASTIPYLITAYVLFCYLAIFQFLVVFSVVAFFYSKIEWKNALLVSLSLALVTFLFSLYLRVNPSALYYRPHELLMTTDSKHGFGKHYLRDQTVRMTMPFGDLEAASMKGVREPRDVLFQTDSLGFRNTRGFQGQETVLFADSFGVSIGSSQECIVTEQLAAAYGMDFYSVSFPGDLSDYQKRWEALKAYAGKDFKSVLFIFEGNDFEFESEEVSMKTNPVIRFITWLKEKHRNSVWGGRIFHWTQNRIARLQIRWISKEWMRFPVVSMPVQGGQEMLFRGEYNEVARRDRVYDEDSPLFELLQKMKDDLAHVFFIPVKFRVYHSFLDPKVAEGPLPNRQWEHLEKTARALGIPVTDLTGPLIEAAGTALQKDEFIFWRDDSHWNCQGAAVAAREIAQILSSE